MPVNDFENSLLTRELLDRVRSIDGFPIAEDEEIIALSDPPYYTACPNPFIKDFFEKHGKPYDPENDDYHREPFAADVSEGKNSKVYLGHAYPTKIPFEAIMRYILHYTEPGDMVFDGFCGTGVTGLAALKCGETRNLVSKSKRDEISHIKYGERYAILNDLSPLGTFISYNFNAPLKIDNFTKRSKELISLVEDEYGWMYETIHRSNDEIQYNIGFDGNKEPIKGQVRFYVWSHYATCPECAYEFILWDEMVDSKNNRVYKEISCPNCNIDLHTSRFEPSWEYIYDNSLKTNIKRRKSETVLIKYTLPNSNNRKLYVKKPDEYDFDIIRKIEDYSIHFWHPINKIPKGDKTADLYSVGINNTHQMYTKRNRIIISKFYDLINKDNIQNKRYKNFLMFWFTSSQSRLTKFNRYMAEYNRHVGPLSNTLYVSPIQAEISPFYFFKSKHKNHKEIDFPNEFNCVTTQSSTNLENIPSNCIDYIFTDPPFGKNLMYSELNYLLESWIKIHTNNSKEAIMNDSQKKSLDDYRKLMELCFTEMNRILKPNRWITVVFHNSQNSVWIAIQESLRRAGFIVADVRTLDKRKGTINQLSYTSGTVKQDLVISAYKPNEGLEKSFRLKAGMEEGVWAFIRQHLKHLPVYVEKEDNVEIVAERQGFLLYDRLVAFHVQRGIAVPISASEFYAGLKQRFPMRDDMYFTVDQVVEYDNKRMKAKRVEQVSLFVYNERSAIQWLRRELSREPQTYQDIQPKFVPELHKEKHEELPELSEILEQNFLQDDEGRWYIPERRREADLEKLREKTLLREFREYKDAKGRLRIFRSEAIRAGFSKCWQEGEYKTIVEVAEKLPTNVLQEESILLMYYDNAVIRTQD